MVPWSVKFELPEVGEVVEGGEYSFLLPEADKQLLPSSIRGGLASSVLLVGRTETLRIWERGPGGY